MSTLSPSGPPPHPEPVRPDTRALAHRAAVVSAIVVLVLGLAFIVWVLRPVLPLLFGGLLVALMLSGMARGIARRTRLGYGAALATGGLGLVALLALAFWFVGDGVVQQLSGIGEAIPVGLERLDALASRTAEAVGADADDVPAVADAVPSVGALAQRALGILGTALGAAVSLVLLLLLGIFMSARPATYRTGVLRLVPLDRRERASEVIAAVVRAVRQWVLARIIIMIGTFFVVWAGMSLIGVPFAAGIGLLTGLVVFVPYVGPYISGSVAVLVALLDSPQTALWAAAFYLTVESVQSWVFEPMIESRMTAAPPALLLTGQIVFGLLFGVAGFILASPLMVALTVLVQTLYVQDVLGDREAKVLGAPDDD